MRGNKIIIFALGIIRESVMKKRKWYYQGIHVFSGGCIGFQQPASKIPKQNLIWISKSQIKHTLFKFSNQTICTNKKMASCLWYLSLQNFVLDRLELGSGILNMFLDWLVIIYMLILDALFGCLLLHFSLLLCPSF